MSEQLQPNQRVTFRAEDLSSIAENIEAAVAGQEYQETLQSDQSRLHRGVVCHTPYSHY